MVGRPQGGAFQLHVRAIRANRCPRRSAVEVLGPGHGTWAAGLLCSDASDSIWCRVISTLQSCAVLDKARYLYRLPDMKAAWRKLAQKRAEPCGWMRTSGRWLLGLDRAEAGHAFDKFHDNVIHFTSAIMGTSGASAAVTRRGLLHAPFPDAACGGAAATFSGQYDVRPTATLHP